LGKIIIVAGVVIVLVGLAVVFRAEIPWLGRLPGDLCIKKENFSFYFPITTSILISVILTLLFSFFRR
jgi:H+/Cl- antiporter ClcA